MATETAKTPPVLKTVLPELRSRWGWFVALGAAFVLLGTVALFNEFLATVVSVYLVGWLMLMGAVAQVMHAFGVKTWTSFLWWVLSGAIYAVAGIVALINPMLASAILTLILAAALAAGGALRILAGMKARPQANWGWLVAAGVVTLLAGVVIAIGWPVNSIWVLGLFLAIDLLFQGWSFVIFGMALRKVA